MSHTTNNGDLASEEHKSYGIHSDLSLGENDENEGREDNEALSSLLMLSKSNNENNKLMGHDMNGIGDVYQQGKVHQPYKNLQIHPPNSNGINGMNMNNFKRPASTERAMRGDSQPLSKTVKIEDLRRFFHLPIVEVAKQLGTCTTALKKICRKNKISKWPYRQIRSITKSIQSLEMASLNDTLNEELRLQYREQIVTLQNAIDELIRDPNKIVTLVNMGLSEDLGGGSSNNNNNNNNSTNKQLLPQTHPALSLGMGGVLNVLPWPKPSADVQQIMQAASAMQTSSDHNPYSMLKTTVNNNNNNNSNNMAMLQAQKRKKSNENLYGLSQQQQIGGVNLNVNNNNSNNIGISVNNNNNNTTTTTALFPSSPSSNQLAFSSLQQQQQQQPMTPESVHSNNSMIDTSQLTNSVPMNKKSKNNNNTGNNSDDYFDTNAAAAIGASGNNNNIHGLSNNNNNNNSNNLMMNINYEDFLGGSDNEMSGTHPNNNNNSHHSNNNNNNMQQYKMIDIGLTNVQWEYHYDNMKMVFTGPVQLAPLQRKKLKPNVTRKVVPLMEPDIGSNFAIEFVPQFILNASHKSVITKSLSELELSLQQQQQGMNSSSGNNVINNTNIGGNLTRTVSNGTPQQQQQQQISTLNYSTITNTSSLNNNNNSSGTINNNFPSPNTMINSSNNNIEHNINNSRI